MQGDVHPCGWMDVRLIISFQSLCTVGVENSFFRKRLVLDRDNLGAVNAWHSLNSKCEFVLLVFRLTVAVAAQNNFVFTLKRVCEINYAVANALSRCQM